MLVVLGQDISKTMMVELDGVTDVITVDMVLHQVEVLVEPEVLVDLEVLVEPEVLVV